MTMVRPIEPRSSFPARARQSVRRVMHLDYDWIDASDVRVHGGARDEVTDAQGVTSFVHASSLDVETANGLLATLHTTPTFDARELVGQSLRQGFRSRLRPLYDAGGAPLGLLLDDLPGAMIAAGYVLAMERTIGPGTAQDTLAPTDGDEVPRGFHQADLCSGWRSDGTMMVAMRAGNFLPFEPLTAVPVHPEGDGGWPATDIPIPGLRRHRRIDVVPDGDGWRVDAWFRDTYRGADAVCGALHEYTVEMVVDATTLTVRDVRALPHALPWTECPAAADAVVKLVGQPIEGLRSSVPRTLQGIESCTHLTNELRELADLPFLVDALSGA
jgi:Protein of unknown function (DUF2889)